MSRLPRLLPVCLAFLCLAAPALSALSAPSARSAQEAAGSGGKHSRAIDVGARGVVERSPGPAGQGPWRGFPVSVSLRDAPLPEVLRAFAKLARFNLVLDPRIPQQGVTVELKDVPWDQALHLILKTHGLAAEVDGQSWLVEPLP